MNVECDKYIKFVNPKILYIFDETFPSVICSKCGNKNNRMFKEGESTEILEILV